MNANSAKKSKEKKKDILDSNKLIASNMSLENELLSIKKSLALY